MRHICAHISLQRTACGSRSSHAIDSPCCGAPVTLSLRTPGRLLLPERLAPGNEPTVRFEPPAHGPKASITKVAAGRMTRTTSLDLLTGEATYISHGEGGLFGEGVLRFDEIDTALSHSLRRELRIVGDDPLSARYRLTQTYEMGRPGWAIRIETATAMSATATHFCLDGEVTASANGEIVCQRQYHAS